MQVCLHQVECMLIQFGKLALVTRGVLCTDPEFMETNMRTCCHHKSKVGGYYRLQLSALCEAMFASGYLIGRRND